jgi:short/branched chain acyl-CoA dehydrogenase
MTSAPHTTTSTTAIDPDLPWCFDDEHRAWREAVREFAEREVAPAAFERNRDAIFDRRLALGLGELGVYGTLISAERGGVGGDLRMFCIAIEELSRIDSGLAASAHVQGIATALLDHLATDDQKRDILPLAISGEAYVSFGLTESSGGSDAGNFGTRARRDGDDWVITGSKEFITNAGTPLSKYVVLFAATGEGSRPGRPKASAFLVPFDAEGMTVAPAYSKLGWRASDTHPIFLDEVRVPGDALLGEEGRGYREALQFLTWARIPIAAMGVGLAQGCFDATLDFVKSRESFGKPLGAHQAVSFELANIAAMTMTARVATYDAAWRYDHGLPFEREAASCKLMGSELANQVAYKATQLHGGYGFMDEYAVTRHYADARILTIGEGSSEVQRMLIARSFGLPV